MNTNMQMHNAWATRPDDERHDSYDSMLHALRERRRASRDRRINSWSGMRAAVNGSELVLQGPSGSHAGFTNWSYSQLARVLRVPTDITPLVRPSTLAQVLNDRLDITTDSLPSRLLLQDRGTSTAPLIRAFHGRHYAVDTDRLWDMDVVCAFIDSLSGKQWTCPRVYRNGDFGSERTPLAGYVSDRDVLVQAVTTGADSDLRDFGKGGGLHRAVFAGNSETGRSSFFYTGLLFDRVCGNNIFWGVEQEYTVRAIHRRNVLDAFQSFRSFLRDGAPIAERAALLRALAAAADTKDNDPFLLPSRDLDPADVGNNETDAVVNRVAKLVNQPVRTTRSALTAMLTEEERPAGTRWDWLQGFTAVARTLPHADTRMELELAASKALLTPVK